jgi:hypothetical protein
MDLLKIGGGSFFGILIPGGFLLFNIVLAFPATPSHLSKVGFQGDGLSIVGITLIYLMFSCILGIVLRILPPDWTEVGHKDKYPYFCWFFNPKKYRSTNQFTEFYQNFVKSEFPDEIKEENWQDVLCSREKALGKSWINYFKLYIYHNGPRLREEVLYGEGLTRFTCGMCYALVLSLGVILISLIAAQLKWIENVFYFNWALLFQVCFYMVLLVIFWVGIPKVRGKEVGIVLESFAILDPTNRPANVKNGQNLKVEDTNS